MKIKNILFISIILLSTLNTFANYSTKVILDNPYKDLHIKITNGYLCDKTTSNKMAFNVFALSKVFETSVKYNDPMKNNYVKIEILDKNDKILAEIYNSNIQALPSTRAYTQNFQMNGKQASIAYTLNIIPYPLNHDKDCPNPKQLIKHVELAILSASLSGKELPQRKDTTIHDL